MARTKKKAQLYRGKFKKGNYGSTKLQPGMRGFILTCSMSGKQLGNAGREMIDLLNEIAPAPVVVPARVSPAALGDSGAEAQSASLKPESTSETPAEATDVLDDDACLDIESELSKELSELKESSSKSGKQRQRFLAVDSGARGVAFVRFNDVDAAEMAHKILHMGLSNGVSPCRLVSRLIPVTHSCKAHLKNIIRTASDMLFTNFTAPGVAAVRYKIDFHARNNDSMKKMDVIGAINDIIQASGQHCVDVSSPDLVIIIDILKTVCCMAVVKDFERFEKYNLGKVSTAESKKGSSSDSQETKESSTVAMPTDSETFDCRNYVSNKRHHEDDTSTCDVALDTPAQKAPRVDTSADRMLEAVICNERKSVPAQGNENIDVTA